MTSKFKCPFCGKTLWHPIGKSTWSCQNWDCLASDNMIGNHTIWEKLIQSQEDLEIARKALEELIAYYDHYDSFDGEISWDGVALIMRNDAHEALKQIEHKE